MVTSRPSGEEMEIVESYLAIERARFEERLVVAIDVPEELRSEGRGGIRRIPPASDPGRSCATFWA
jgi:hypothetical protein